MAREGASPRTSDVLAQAPSERCHVVRTFALWPAIAAPPLPRSGDDVHAYSFVSGRTSRLKPPESSQW